MNKKMVYAVVAVLAITQLYTCGVVRSLRSELASINYRINNIDSSLNGRIDAIYTNVDNMLEEEASIIHDARTIMGEWDLDALTVPITFVVEPKAVSQTMTVSLQFDDETLLLKKEDISYIGTKTVALSDATVYPKIIIEENGVQSITQHLGLRVVELIDTAFPSILYPRFSGETGYGSNTYRRNGEVDMDIKGDAGAFVSMNLVTCIDEEAVDVKPFDISEGVPFLEVEDTYTVQAGQVIETLVVGVDANGFTHAYTVDHYVAGDKVQREPFRENRRITAPNGKVVYTFDETNAHVVY